MFKRRARFTTLVELMDAIPDLPHVGGALFRVEAEALLNEKFAITGDVETRGPFHGLHCFYECGEVVSVDCFSRRICFFV